MLSQPLFRIAVYLLVSGCAAVVAAPQERPKAFAKASSSSPKMVVNPARDQIVPLVYDGNGWTTLFMIANLDNKTIVVQTFFSANDGSDLPLPVVGIGRTNSVEVTLPPGANYSFVTSGVDANRTTGYAYVTAKNGSDLFGGYASVRNQSANLPDLEFTVPLTPIDENFFTLAFDNVGGYSTYAMLINSSNKNNASVRVSVQDIDGNVVATGTISIDPYGRYAFNLADFYPVDGRVGNVYFSAGGGQFVAGSGLRVGPNQSFNLIPVLSLPR